MSIVTHHRSESLLIATWQNTIVTVSWQLIPIALFDEIDREQRRLYARFPGGLGALTIIPRGGTAGIPDAEFRAAAARITAAWDGRILGSARVVEADGFGGSVVRAALSAIKLVSRSRTPTAVFSQRKEAAEWLCSRPGQPPEVRIRADELARALERIA